MDIAQAKRQVKDAIEAYTSTDEGGRPLIEDGKQRPIFLVGPPGIGKTAIMAQIASELDFGLVSYSMTHHTRQSALGLPFIVHREYDDIEFEASEYTMSEIVASVYEYRERSGHEKGILFLDEVNCVSETLYPSMLQFLQFKRFGSHRIPQGWIIVTAGNPPEYNSSVHEFDIVTLDRLKRIEIEPSYEAWKSYATSKRTHASVLNFLGLKSERFYSIRTTFEGKSFVTARGWDDLSEIITAYERLGKAVDYDLVIQYVQDEQIAGEFSSYYELFCKYREDYRIDAILAGIVEDEIRERARAAGFDERLSLIGMLADALCGSMDAVMVRTDAMKRVRDELRALKADLPAAVDAADGAAAGAVGADVRAGGSAVGFAQLVSESRDAARRKARASLESGLSGRESGRLDDAVLECWDDLVSRLASGGPTRTFADVQRAFSDMAAELYVQGDPVERRLTHAFDFIEGVFGEGQEMTVFVAELTSRRTSARYIAHYGSESYYAHNTDMILSERQSELMRRVEQLEV